MSKKWKIQNFANQKRYNYIFMATNVRNVLQQDSVPPIPILKRQLSDLKPTVLCPFELPRNAQWFL